MNWHTGFQIKGYDLSVQPVDYWPPVKQGPRGLVLDC
jgi:hypothetical protein